jgi:uncharacterized protein (TIGR02598 family)
VITNVKYLRKKGFSLIEVLFAMTIFSFAIISILGLMAVGLKTFKESMDNTIQSNIMQSVVNDLNISDASQLATGIKTSFYDTEGNLLSSGSDPKVYYTAQVEMVTTDVEGIAAGDLPAETVCLRIVNKTAPKKTNTFTTIVTR